MSANNCLQTRTEMNTPSKSIRDAALDWAARGFRVFPITPGDKIPPKGMTFKTEATTDAAKIKAWWAFNPNYNYAIHAGNGVLIVDVDKAKNGFASLLDLDLPDATLTVRTPGGGLHLYFTGPDVGISVDRVAPGIDIRSAGGYVVGPGSYFADPKGEKGYAGPYTIELDTDMAAAPTSLVIAAGTSKAKEVGPALAVDEPGDIEFAKHYLLKDAPIAIEGKGGNNTTYIVAAKLIELGVSASRAADLLADHWNERCSPPWDKADLIQICGNAENYAQNKQGSGSVTLLAEEGGDPADATIEPRKVLTQKAFAIPELDFSAMTSVAPRKWLYGKHFIRGFVSSTVGTGGVGKTALLLAECLAIVTGSPLLGEEPAERAAVAYLQLEDPLDEMYRRIQAIVSHNKIEAWEIAGRFFVASDLRPGYDPIFSRVSAS